MMSVKDMSTLVQEVTESYVERASLNPENPKWDDLSDKQKSELKKMMIPMVAATIRVLEEKDLLKEKDADET